MFLYFIFFIVLTFFAFIQIFNTKDKEISTFIFIILAFLLWLSLGLRWQCLTDWNAYYNFFVYGRKFSLSIEPGFVYLTETIKFVFNNYTFYLFVIYFFILYFFLKKIIKSSEFFLVGLLYFYVNFYFNLGGIRQIMALSITFYALKYIEEKNALKFYITLIIASLFHFTALFFAPAYLVKYFRIKTFVAILIILLFIILNYLNIFNHLIFSIISKLSFSGEMLNKVTIYTRSVEQITILTHFKRLIFVILLLLLRPILERKIPNYNIYFNLIFFSVILFYFFIGTYDWIATRGVMYYSMAELIVITYFFTIVKDDLRNRIAIFVFVLFFCFIKLVIAVNQPGIGEYTTILNYEYLN
jgi:hypothetical protein